jgi:hypothetical protein
MTVTVDVPPRYVRRAREMGTDRNKSFEEREGYDNHQNTGGEKPESRHQVGMIGEIAFAIYADLQVNSELMEWSDGGVDFKASIDDVEQTIDVKTRQTKPYVFSVKEESVNADLFILGYLEEDTSVTFLGMATKEMVLNGNRKWSQAIEKYNYQVSLSSLEPVPDSESIECLS